MILLKWAYYWRCVDHNRGRLLVLFLRRIGWRWTPSLLRMYVRRQKSIDYAMIRLNLVVFSFMEELCEFFCILNRSQFYSDHVEVWLRWLKDSHIADLLLKWFYELAEFNYVHVSGDSWAAKIRTVDIVQILLCLEWPKQYIAVPNVVVRISSPKLLKSSSFKRLIWVYRLH